MWNPLNNLRKKCRLRCRCRSDVSGRQVERTFGPAAAAFSNGLELASGSKAVDWTNKADQEYLVFRHIAGGTK
jgi:hypothetical protein